MEITEANSQHAGEICALIRASILALCTADHRNNNSILDQWLSNKTEINCRVWIDDPHSTTFVVLVDKRPTGVTQIGRDGYIYRCYVHPKKVRTGLGSQLIRSCETQKRLEVEHVNR